MSDLQTNDMRHKRYIDVSAELSVGWVDPRVGLGWVGLGW